MAIQHALFVPADSTYMKLGASGEPASLAWQHSLRGVWDANASGSGGAVHGSAARGAAAAAAAAGAPPPPLPAAPPPGLVAAAAAAPGAPHSAVLPSLAVTLDWLRRCVREAPALRMRVLVTGSLYLVGDLLKTLQQDGSGGAGAGGSNSSGGGGGGNGT